MSRRSCAFCGATGKISAEHIWPRWFGKLMEQRFGERTYKISGLGNDRDSATAAPITVRRVCESCNNGWMHDLEDLALPIARSLISADGAVHRINRADQRVLARWAVMKALVFALASPNGSPVPEGEYRRYREQQRPSGEATLVWIGAYKGSERAAWGSFSTQQFNDPPELEPVAGYIATMHLHRLIVQVVDIFSNHEVRAKVDRPGMSLIWPPHHDVVVWPDRGLAFNDSDFEYLTPPIAILDRDEA